MYRLTVLIFCCIVSMGCGGFGRNTPTATPAAPAPTQTARVVFVTVPPATVEVITPAFMPGEAPNGIRIVVDLDNLYYEGEAVGSSGIVTITENSVKSENVALEDQVLRFFTPTPFGNPPPLPFNASGTQAPPQTPTPARGGIRPNQVDNPYCDVTYPTATVKAELCRSYKDFDIDTRCLNRAELAVELNRAGWPSSELTTAVDEFMQESNGCVNAIDGGAVGVAGIAWLGHTKTGWNAERPRFPQYEDRNPYDVTVNLSLALEIWLINGWRPWRGGQLVEPTRTAVPTRRPTSTQPPQIAPTAPVAPPEPTVVPPTIEATVEPEPTPTGDWTVGGPIISTQIAYWSLVSAEIITGRPTVDQQWRMQLSVRLPTGNEATFSAPFMESSRLAERNNGGDDFYLLNFVGLACATNYNHPLTVRWGGLPLIVQHDDPPYQSGNINVNAPCDG